MEMYVMMLMGWMRMEMKMKMVQWSEEWKEKFITLIFILFFMIFSYYYSYSNGIHSYETNSQWNISKVMIGKIAKNRAEKKKLGKWKTYFMSFDDYSHYDNSSITTNVVAHFKWPESINARGEFTFTLSTYGHSYAMYAIKYVPRQCIQLTILLDHEHMYKGGGREKSRKL